MGKGNMNQFGTLSVNLENALNARRVKLYLYKLQLIIGLNEKFNKIQLFKRIQTFTATNVNTLQIFDDFKVSHPAGCGVLK